MRTATRRKDGFGDMWIIIALTVGATALVVTWSIGLPADVGGLIGLGFLSLGILAQMAERARGRESG